MPPAPTAFKDKLRFPSVIQVTNKHGSGAELHIDLKPVQLRLHSELPEATFWGYNGEVPGPTINLHRRTHVEVHWHNRIPGTLPFPAVRVPTTDPSNGDEL